MALNIAAIPGSENFMDAFLRQKQQGILNRQKQQELNETENYHKRSLDIHQAASDRAQALLPFSIQQYKDNHNGKITENAKNHLEFQITKKFYDEAMKENAPIQAESPQIPTQQESLPELQEQSAQQRLVQPGTEAPGKPSLADIMQNFMPQRPPMQNMQQQIKQQVYNPGLNIQDSSAFQPENAPQPSQVPQQQQPAQAPQAGPKTLPNGEVEISPGNPNLYLQIKWPVTLNQSLRRKFTLVKME